jgi:hypothetical protein
MSPKTIPMHAREADAQARWLLIGSLVTAVTGVFSLSDQF